MRNINAVDIFPQPAGSVEGVDGDFFLLR